MLERTRTYQKRVQAAQREAVARDMASRGQGAYRVAETAVTQRGAGSALRWRLGDQGNASRCEPCVREPEDADEHHRVADADQGTRHQGNRVAARERKPPARR